VREAHVETVLGILGVLAFVALILYLPRLMAKTERNDGPTLGGGPEGSPVGSGD
jgi:hypothetical protein